MSALNEKQIRLLNEDQVAETLRVSVATVRRWRSCRRGPKFIKVGAAVRYDSRDLHAWLASRPAGGERGPEAADE